jgi:hypothetical protein
MAAKVPFCALCFCELFIKKFVFAHFFLKKCIFVNFLMASPIKSVYLNMFPSKVDQSLFAARFRLDPESL